MQGKEKGNSGLRQRTSGLRVYLSENLNFHEARSLLKSRTFDETLLSRADSECNWQVVDPFFDSDSGQIEVSRIEQFFGYIWEYEQFFIVGLSACFELFCNDLSSLPVSSILGGLAVIEMWFFTALRDGPDKHKSSIAAFQAYTTWVQGVRDKPEGLRRRPRRPSVNGEIFVRSHEQEGMTEGGHKNGAGVSLIENGVEMLRSITTVARRITHDHVIALTRMCLLMSTVCLLNMMLDLSAMYHIIRAQSGMKIYVLYGMLEILERLVRSLGLDVLNELEAFVWSLVEITNCRALRIYSQDVVRRATELYSEAAKNGDSLPHINITGGNVAVWSWFEGTPRLRVVRRNVDGTLSKLVTGLSFENQSVILANSLVEFPCGLEHRMEAAQKGRTVDINDEELARELAVSPKFALRCWRNSYRLLLYFMVALIYNLIHVSMHIVRILVTNSAMYSTDSIVFVLLVNANFNEIKSTVFKRFTPKGFFVIAASDTVERFQMIFDASLVQMRNFQTQKEPLLWTTRWALLMWLTEVIVDNMKRSFIFKFMKLHSNVIGSYRRVLLSDVLKRDLRGKEHPVFRWKVNQRFRDGAIAGRVGFASLSYATLFVLFFPSFPKYSGSHHIFSWASIHVFSRVAILLELFLVKIIITVLLSYAAVVENKKSPLGDADEVLTGLRDISHL